jgi:hypothetical protein
MIRKNQNKIALFAAAALLASALLTGCGAAASSTAASSEEVASSVAVSEAASSEAASEEASAQTVQATFTVVYADETSEEFTLEVEDGTLLSDALRDAGLISEEEAAAGFVTEVNGVLADWNADQAWWCLTDGNGEMTSVGVGDIELHEGDSYAFTYTAG